MGAWDCSSISACPPPVKASDARHGVSAVCIAVPPPPPCWTADLSSAGHLPLLQVAGWLGEAALQAALQAVDPLLVDQLNELMGGRGAGGGPAQLDNGGGDDGMTEGGA